MVGLEDELEQFEREILEDLDINYDEGKYYIDKYRALNFPLIVKIGGKGLLKDENEQPFKYFAKDLETLGKLKIQVMGNVGSGPQIDKVFPKTKEKKIDGIRYTTKKLAKFIARTQKKLCNDVTRAAKGMVIPLTDQWVIPIFTGEFLDKKKYGYVGKVKKVERNMIGYHYYDMKKVFLSWSVSVTEGERDYTKLVDGVWKTIPSENPYEILNTNADDIAFERAKTYKSPIVIFLTGAGGFYKNGEVHNKKKLIYKASESYIKRMIDRKDLTGGMLYKAKKILQIINLKHRPNVRVTSPKNLLYELFTKKGKGTYIHK